MDGLVVLALLVGYAIGWFTGRAALKRGIRLG